MNSTNRAALLTAIALAAIAAAPPKAKPRAAAPARPLTAAPFALDCEQEDTTSIAQFNTQAFYRYAFGRVKFMIDPVAKTAVIDGTLPDGSSTSVVRNLLSVTPDLILLCQADTCQKEVADGAIRRTFGLTRIDLQTLRLTRRVNESAGDLGSANYVASVTDRVSECRVI